MSHAAWIQQAESDLAAAKVLNAASHHSQAVWFAAQAVEKAHKAVLVALGLRYEDKHFIKLGHSTGEISKLLPAALHEPIDLQIADLVLDLETRARESRYPIPDRIGNGPAVMIAPAVSITKSAEDIEAAELLLGWCRERIKRAERAVEAMKP